MGMRRVWEWCAKWLPEDQTDRFLVVTVVVSVLLHVLVGVVLIMGGNLEQQRIASKRGEALLAGDVLTRCHTQANCTAVCPMQLSPTDSILALRRRALLQLVGFPPR